MGHPRSLSGQSGRPIPVGQAVQRACRAIGPVGGIAMSPVVLAQLDGLAAPLDGPVGMVLATLALVWAAAIVFFLCGE